MERECRARASMIASVAAVLLTAACSSGGSGGPELDSACDRYLDAVWNADLPGRAGQFDGISVPEAEDYARFRSFCLSRADALGLSAERVARCAGSFRGRVGSYNCADGCLAGVGGICDLTLCSQRTISAEGGLCKTELDCEDGTICGNRGRCERLARLGEPCGLDGQGAFAGPDCVAGLFCRDTCRRYPAVGEDCREVPRCAGAAWCNQETNVCVAVERRSPGEACEGPGTSCRDGLCMNGRCTEPMEDGQACSSTELTRLCRSFSACVDGVCTPLDKNPSCRGGG